jgi:cobalt-zinc-cadmium efflux system outer membrane protein
VLSASIGFTSTAGAVDRFGFGIAQDFLDLLLLPARTRLAKADFARAQLDAGDAVMALAADVDRAYYGYVAARQLAELHAAIADAAQTAAVLATSLHAAGNLSRLELALQQSAAAQAQLERIDAASMRDAARLALDRAMGLDPADGARWETPAGLPLPPASDDDVGALQALAIRDRLDLQAARARVTALEDRLGTARRSRFADSATVGAIHERDTDNARITGPELSLSLPLFAQGQGRVLAAQAELEQARADADALQLDVAHEVALSAMQAAAAHARVHTLRAQLVPLREQIVARTQEQMNFMLADAFDLLLARQQEFDAWRRYIEAARDEWLARIDLARAVGGRLPNGTTGGGVIDTHDLVPRDDTHSLPSSDAAPADAPAAPGHP